jgi:hypothetical protein
MVVIFLSTILLLTHYTFVYYTLSQAQTCTRQCEHNQCEHAYPRHKADTIKPRWNSRCFWVLLVSHTYELLFYLPFRPRSTPLYAAALLYKVNCKKRQQSHKRKKPHNIHAYSSSSPTMNSAHFKPRSICKLKYKKNEASPLHPSRLYTLITEAHITSHCILKHPSPTQKLQNIRKTHTRYKKHKSSTYLDQHTLYTILITLERNTTHTPI